MCRRPTGCLQPLRAEGRLRNGARGFTCGRDGAACLERGGRSSAADRPRATTDLDARRPLGGLNTRDDRDDRARTSERSERVGLSCACACSAHACARESALFIGVLGGFVVCYVLQSRSASTDAESCVRIHRCVYRISALISCQLCAATW